VNGHELRQARSISAWTQEVAAQKLGVTQAYLSMVERGIRPVSSELASKAFRLLPISATALPLRHYQRHSHDDAYFRKELGALGYPGFSHVRRSSKHNPAELFMEALDSENLDSRVIEALPWLPIKYSAMNWDWLTSNAKFRDRQNRLAFVIGLAAEIAQQKDGPHLAAELAKRVDVLQRSRLRAEDTLCHQSMTKAERNWLRTNRSPAAAHWNLLTDLSIRDLDHSFV
jgi:transcriptional regulator with XRE-family HTH domain